MISLAAKMQEESMIKPSRVGHATLETPDLDKALAYWVEVNGLKLAARESGRAYLASKTGLLTLALEQGGDENLTRISFEVSPTADFADLAKALGADGIKSEVRSDPVPGIGKVLAFQDPKGTTIELFQEWSYLGNHHQVIGAGPLKLGHIAYVVPDPAAIADFYCRVLGFRVSDWIEDFFVFLRCNPDHHTVNFIRGAKTKMHHIAFELKDFAHIQHACELLAVRKIPINWGPVRHGPGHNVAIYHRNADGQNVELYIELDQMKNEELGYFDPRPWHHDTPQRPKIWERKVAPALWGPMPAPDFQREHG
jgi:catechol 2,3-dioxygenase-like lactoylglutathione lyase family enzyme